MLARILGLAFVAAGIVWLGLLPFDLARPNRVSWIEPEPGLRFESGMALAERERVWDTREHTAELALELWLRSTIEPDDELRDFFVLVDGADVPPLRIGQEGADLVVRDRVTKDDGEEWANDFRVPGALRPGALQHVGVTTATDRLFLFVDGRPVEPTVGFAIPLARRGEPFGGRVLLGTDAKGIAPWKGELLGLVLHDRSHSAETIAERALLAPRFEDASAFDLPPTFRPPGIAVLGLPDPRHVTTIWYALDAVLNLALYVPLGYLLGALARRSGGRRVLFVGTIAAIGFGLSLSIELLQSLSVSRDSSLQDLLLNTLGALAGALLGLRR